MTILDYLIKMPFGTYPITDESKKEDLQKIIDERIDFKNDFRLYIEENTLKKDMLTYDEAVWKQNEFNERMAKMDEYFGFKKSTKPL